MVAVGDVEGRRGEQGGDLGELGRVGHLPDQHLLRSHLAVEAPTQERPPLRELREPRVEPGGAVPEQPRRGGLGPGGAHQRQPVLLGPAQGQLMGAHLGSLPGQRRDPAQQAEAAPRGAVGGHELVGHQVEARALVADQDAELEPAPEVRRRPGVDVVLAGDVVRVRAAEVDAHHVAQVAPVQLLALGRADHVVGRRQNTSEPDVLGVEPDPPEGMQSCQSAVPRG